MEQSCPAVDSQIVSQLHLDDGRLTRGRSRPPHTSRTGAGCNVVGSKAQSSELTISHYKGRPSHLIIVVILEPDTLIVV